MDCGILPAAFALTNASLCLRLPAVFRILVSQILDRTEPVLYSSMSSEIITVFQYYNYFASHSVNDLGSYLLQLAKEGRVYKFWQLQGSTLVSFWAQHKPVQPWGWFCKRRGKGGKEVPWILSLNAPKQLYVSRERSWCRYTLSHFYFHIQMGKKLCWKS